MTETQQPLMGIQLDPVVPFGRSLDEYTQIFSLTQPDLQKSILSVADGSASFNAEGTALGYRIQSLDPLYAFTAEQIRDRFYAVVDPIIAQVKASPNSWIWTYHTSPEGLQQHREQVINAFCQDFPQGKAQGRYIVGRLPVLPYQDHEYELGLCSHFLFLYSDHFDATFHHDAICEMLRVCREVRIFPLLTLNLALSPYVIPLIQGLTKVGYRCEILPVAYELQRGGNQMLRIRR